MQQKNIPAAQGGADLGSGSVGRLLFKLAVPAIVAQVINVLYNMVDRMYIGHLPEIGETALTGVGVCFPLITAISAFAALVSMGGAPRASIFLGRGDKETAEKILGNCATALVVVGVALTAVFFAFGYQLLGLFGASEDTIGYAWQYFSIYLVGTIFVQASLGLNAFINAQGYTMVGMLTVVIGAVLNIILDPILMFGFDMGVAGAALATIISQAISAAFTVWFLCSKRSYLRLKASNLRLVGKILWPSIALGLSPFVMQLTESVISICFNTQLQIYGGDIAVGAMTILSSVMQFAMLPLQGLTQGAQPITSFNFGAGKMDRVVKAFRILLISCLTYATALWAICEFAPQLVIGIFTPADGALGVYTRSALRIYMAASLLFGAQIACQQTFVALGKAGISLFLAVLRKIILLVPLIFLLPRVLPIAQDTAVFLAEPVADTLAVITTCTMFGIVFGGMVKKKK
ncbi:MAG TPA: MATE family efflux transporter [Candidatus Gemmiger faecigallinarum]|nr:MATE family efflux transporter [Candidatus Gemmiger faecigallinarum]